MKKPREDCDYQLDLTPFISLLSVCICFLLVTVAWYQVGALTMKQVVGKQTTAESSSNEEISLWVYLEPKNVIRLTVKKGVQIFSSRVIDADKKQKKINDTQFKIYVSSLIKQNPRLQQAFILPTSNIVYKDVIKVMDRIRQSGIFNVGISPL